MVLIRIAIAVITYKGQKVVVKVIPKAKVSCIEMYLHIELPTMSDY